MSVRRAELFPAVPAAARSRGSDNGAGPMLAEPHFTDLGNAERLVADHGAAVKFCPSIGWLIWSGQRWKEDTEGFVQELAKTVVRDLYFAAGEATDEDLRKALAAHALRSEAERPIRAMVTLAQSDPRVVVLPERLDADPWLLNVANGVLDLRTGELGEHRLEDLMTKIAPVDYDPRARADAFEFFVEEVFPDREVRDFVQRWVGYGLTGDVREQAFVLGYGAGSNGKTTFIELLRDLLGDYAQPTRAETLLAKRGGDGIPNDVAGLRGMRFVYAVEPERGRRLAEALVKALTGGDTITARFLRREFFSFRPTFKLTLMTNHRPRVLDPSHAMWRRVKLVPFTVTIPEADQDRTLPARLRAELPGILNWALEGCRLWQRYGLGEPAAVRAATAEYRGEQDVAGSFLEDACVVEEGSSVTAGELYEAYRAWCGRAGEEPLSKRAFGGLLGERGFQPERSRRDRRWRGLRLRNPGEPVLFEEAEAPAWVTQVDGDVR